ncbi:hypothetical protein [Methylomonas sp. MO1]|uniref:hypothetical protein n=1 Tax=Methylomonas sp. MO1 TaxID=3073619 RepID=UPI00391806AE
MKPTRQLECVELMISANTITINYAEALLVATPSSMLCSSHLANTDQRSANVPLVAKALPD